MSTRAVRLSPAPQISPAVATLLLVNLIPVFGVAFLGWELFSVLRAYWIESAIIGGYNVLAILIASGRDEHGGGGGGLRMLPVKLGVVAFFCVHYGIFMLVHGVFLFTTFGPDRGGAWGPLLRDGVAAAADSPFVWALVVSHGVAFVLGFLRSGAWREVHYLRQMFRPYVRIVPMHLTVLFGGALVAMFDLQVAGLVVLVGCKVAAELVAAQLEPGSLTI